MCRSIILSTKGKTTISYCTQCQNHYIWQQSFMLTFNPEQYDFFLTEIKRKMGTEEFYHFPDGDTRVMVNTPVHEILFTFTEEEWSDFTNTLDEAVYMRNVYQLIS